MYHNFFYIRFYHFYKVGSMLVVTKRFIAYVLKFTYAWIIGGVVHLLSAEIYDVFENLQSKISFWRNFLSCPAKASDEVQ